MAEEKRQLSEQEILALGNEQALLALGSMQAIESLQSYLSHYGEGFFSALTDNFYSESQLKPRDHYTGSLIINPDSQENIFPKGIEAYVEEKLKDDKCKGFVPLTESVVKILTDKYQMKQIAVGLKLMPENVWYELYK
ncbi:MAG: hypothetical protein WC781_04545 [Candidatus Pacearchaeota archaeon]|jgi:hypothetical protein